MDPAEVDCIVRKAWDQVYQGNVPDGWEQARKFEEDFGQHIHHAEPLQIQDIQGEDLSVGTKSEENCENGLAWPGLRPTAS